MKTQLLFILILTSCFSVFAQKEDETKITIYKPEENTAIQGQGDEYISDEHCIKWNYYLLGRGVFLLNYEHPINKYFSVEAGVGVTYRDFIYESYNLDVITFAGEQSSKFGFAFEVGPRIYPSEFDNFEGFFVMPMISYRKYSIPTDYDGVASGAYQLSQSALTFKQGYTFLDYQFKIGYQYESIFDWDILGEFYAGVAIRNAVVNGFQEIQNSLGNYELVPTTQNRKNPQFLLGLKIGFPF